MFVYNARREDWIQENDVSVFKNFRIRPSTLIRIRFGLKKFPFWRAFSKISGYGRKIGWICVDASRIRKNKVAFSHISGHVWTGPKSAENKQHLCYETKSKQIKRRSRRGSRFGCPRIARNILGKTRYHVLTYMGDSLSYFDNLLL